MTPEERRRRSIIHAKSSEIDFEREVVEAVQVATQVIITDAVIQAFRPGIKEGGVLWHRTRAKLRKAFEAAGFEVLDK